MKSIFIYPLRVHIEDTDYAGVVYHANYLKFMERARSEWAEEVGMGIKWQQEEQIYFPVHSLTIQYLKPIRLTDQVEVVTAIKAVRKASLIYEQYLRLANAPDNIICKAEVKVVCVDAAMRPRGLPDHPFMKQQESER